jgi:hypothetical protein
MPVLKGKWLLALLVFFIPAIVATAQEFPTGRSGDLPYAAGGLTT